MQRREHSLFIAGDGATGLPLQSLGDSRLIHTLACAWAWAYSCLSSGAEPQARGERADARRSPCALQLALFLLTLLFPWTQEKYSSPWRLSSEESACSSGDVKDAGWIPEWGRSPGKRNGNPFQCSCLGNPVDRGAWRAIVHGVTNRHD